MNRLIYCFAGILSTITLVASLVLMGAYATADSVDDVTVVVPAACTFADIVDGTHTATIQNGHLENNIGTTTFTTYCNDSAGFSIYAIGYSGDTYGNTDLIASNPNNSNIATGLTTSGSPSAWAMKLIPVANAYTPTIENDFDEYSEVPSTYTKVATFNTVNDSSIGSTIQSTYRVFAASGQAADTYIGKVRYTLVHPASEVPAQPQTTQSGKICYYANASDVVGSMGCQDVAASVTLLASNFSRTGYGFAGWSTTFDYSDQTGFYGPNETITLNTANYSSPNNGLSLYAYWIKSAGNLQGWTGCSSLQSGAVTALSDQRDTNTYAVAKLADGNCWMIENLRLADKDSNNNDVILSSTNTNNPSLPLTNVYDTGSTSNHLSPTSSIAYVADTAPEGWCTTDLAACDDQSRIRTDNTANRDTYTSGQTVSSQNANLYSYGNYYNWYSATAGNGTYSFNTNNNSVGGDLCPTGWRLPKGGDKTRITSNNDNEFWNLIVTGLNGGTLPANYDNSTNPYYGSTEAGPIANALRTYPNNFLYSGYVNGASLNNRGSNGYYWSSTAYNSNYAYYLYFSSTSVSPGTNSSSEYCGWAVRCVASGA